MLNQKVKNLLLVAIVVVLITTLAFILTIRSSHATAQVQNLLNHDAAETGLVINQPLERALSYQGVYTNPNTLNPPGEAESEKGYPEVVTDLESALSPQSTNSGSEHVPASAFRSDGFPGAAVGYRFSVVGGTFPGGYVRNNSTDDVCMAAPVYLPNGKTVTRFSIFFMDDDPVFDMDYVIHLWRKNQANPGSTAQQMASIVPSSPIDDTTIFRVSDTTINNPVISNSYGYYITFCLHANTDLQHLVYGFKVDYTP
jgi:hypothetical protein